MKDKEKRGKQLLSLYILGIIWVILFKFQVNIDDIKLLSEYNFGTVNLLPFQAPRRINGVIDYSEIIYNVLIFIPFGLLLPVASKKMRLLGKVASILLFTVFLEVSQYVFSLGACDITDVITNLTGGLIGLVIYWFLKKIIEEEKLDQIILVLSLIVFIAVLFIIIFFF